MADKKISQLTAATTPLDGTEVLPIVQGTTTKKVANNDLRPKQIQSNATSGVLQVVGPAAASTRVMTTPDANFTVARTDAAQTFAGNNTFTGTNKVSAAEAYFGLEATNPNGKLWYVISGGGGNLSTGYLGLFNATNGNLVWAIAPSTTQDFVTTTTGDFQVRTGNLVISTSGKGIDFSATPGTGTSELLADYEEGTWTPTPSGITVNSGTPVYSGFYTKVGRLVTVNWYMSGGNITTVAGTSKFTNLPFANGSGYSHGIFIDELTYASGPMESGPSTNLQLFAAITGSYMGGTITYMAAT